MPEPAHHLPTDYDRPEGQITGPVLDSIVISARSHGRLYLPGEYSTGDRPPAHEVKVVSTDPDNESVHTEQVQRGSPDRYTVSYDVWNYRDSHVSARIILTGQADPARPDTPGG
jgi:hypothetical protein